MKVTPAVGVISKCKSLISAVIFNQIARACAGQFHMALVGATKMVNFNKNRKCWSRIYGEVFENAAVRKQSSYYTHVVPNSAQSGGSVLRKPQFRP